jgi:magnesium chelatase family protein
MLATRPRGSQRRLQRADDRQSGHGQVDAGGPVTTILPPLTEAESLETTRIYSATGRLPADEPLMTRRSFRTRHHTISDAGMVGGGNPPAPGEISLSHHGVNCQSNLFLNS